MVKDKGAIANELKPFEPTHPGEVLKDEIDCRGISQRQLAHEIGVSSSLLNPSLILNIFFHQFLWPLQLLTS